MSETIKGDINKFQKIYSSIADSDGRYRCGVRDINYNVILLPLYDEVIIDNKNEQFLAKEQGTFHLFNKNGQCIRDLSYAAMKLEEYDKQVFFQTDRNTPFDFKIDLNWHNDFYKEIDGKVGLLDKNCNEIIPNHYFLIFYCKSNLLLYKGNIAIHKDGDEDLADGYYDFYSITGGLWGVSNFLHKIFIPFEYDFIDSMLNEFTDINDLFLVNKGGSMYYANEHPQDEMYYSVNGGKWGLVNDKNEVVVPIEFDITQLYRDKILFQKSNIELFDDKLPYEPFYFK